MAASIAFRWASYLPFQQIGTEQGLLPAPVDRPAGGDGSGGAS